LLCQSTSLESKRMKGRVAESQGEKGLTKNVVNKKNIVVAMELVSIDGRVSVYVFEESWNVLGHVVIVAKIPHDERF